MRIYFVLCFALVAFTQVQLGLAGLPGPPGRKGPTGPKGVPPPYCQVSSKITDFLKQFRSTSLKGAASGEKGSAGSTSSMVSYAEVHILMKMNIDGSNIALDCSAFC